MTREASIKQLLPLIQCFFPGRDFPGSSVVKNLPANAGDAGSISESGKILRRRKFLPGKFSWTEELSWLL